MYLASAKSIFTNDMLSYYQWAREPGYALFLKFVLYFSNLDIVISVAQGTIFAFSALYLAKEMGLFKQTRVVTIFLLLSLPTTLGFIGDVLQQILMSSLVMCLAASGIGVLNSLHASSKSKNIKLLVFLIFCCISSLFTFILLPVEFALCLYIFFQLEKSILPSRKSLNLIAGFALSQLPLISWWVFKFLKVGYGPVSTGSAWGWQGAVRAQYGDANFLAVVSGLLGIGEDSHVPGRGIHETWLYGLGNPNENCGVIGGPEDFFNYIAGMVRLTCRNTEIYNHYQHYSELSFKFVTFIIVFGILIGIKSMLQIRGSHTEKIVMISVFSLLGTYLIGGAGISRYSFPVFAPVLIFLTLKVQDRVSKKGKMVNLRGNRVK